MKNIHDLDVCIDKQDDGTYLARVVCAPPRFKAITARGATWRQAATRLVDRLRDAVNNEREDSK